jgi:hypothetical protein
MALLVQRKGGMGLGQRLKTTKSVGMRKTITGTKNERKLTLYNHVLRNNISSVLGKSCSFGIENHVYASQLLASVRR